MDAVKADADWDLKFEGQVYIAHFKARALWDRIMRATYETAEPASSSSTHQRGKQPRLLRNDKRDESLRDGR